MKADAHDEVRPKASRAEIRWAALIGSALMGVTIAAFRLVGGRGPLDAAGAGLGAAACSLAAWWAYHLACGRTDGLAIVAFGLTAYAPQRPASHPGYVALLMIPLGAALGGIAGWLLRDSQAATGDRGNSA